MDKKIDYLKEGKRNIEEGKYQEAYYNLQKALKEHPNYPDINNLMGVALSLSGRYKEAVKYFKKAIQLNPDYIEVHINYALALNQLGKVDKANEEFELTKTLEMGRESEIEKVEFSVRAKIANAHKEIAILYASIDRHDDSIEELEKALRFAPNFHDIRTFLGEILMEKGDYEGAKKELKEVLKRNGNFIPAAVKLGLVYYKEGNKEMAREIWGKAKELDPKNKSLKMYLDLLKK
ncbi:MAG: tetratricopeptide repeat protein [candidate division WOR-3 bacterium]|nr:tetratricopeptide repeat protein [candidate division WOR-3 bacterium]